MQNSVIRFLAVAEERFYKLFAIVLLGGGAVMSSLYFFSRELVRADIIPVYAYEAVSGVNILFWFGSVTWMIVCVIGYKKSGPKIVATAYAVSCLMSLFLFGALSPVSGAIVWLLHKMM